MSVNPNSFLVFFGIAWSAMTLLFDGFLLVPASRQVIALSYPSTEGTILSSEVTYREDSEGGTTHGVSLRYLYLVGKQEFTGRRYSYDTSTSSDSAWARAVVASSPPGAKVRVFYNPHNPQNCVLTTGLHGSDLFQAAFMTPFNAAMLGFWWAGWACLSRTWSKPIAGGVKTITMLRRTRVRLTPWSPFGAALGTTAILAFASVFVVGFFAGGFHPSMRTMLMTWSVILSGGIAAGGWHAVKVFGGKYDLIIDEMAGMLELPVTEGRKNQRRVSFSDVEDVYVETILNPSTSTEQTNPFYAPTLLIQGANPEKERLVQWCDRDKAAEFAEWLREKLPQRFSSSRPLAGRF